jgi:uncharacterized phiE125 gp8 family phage protein
MALKIITAPATEPVTLAECRQQLRIDTLDDDTLLTALITAARESCEHLLGRALITQTLELVLDEFPSGDEICLQRPPVSSITSIKYLDDAGVEQTWSSANYTLDTDDISARVLLATPTTIYPSTYDRDSAVRIRYVAGYGAASAVPVAIKQWILIRVATLYEYRTQIMAGVSVNELPGGFVDRLIDRYRIW